MSDQQANGQEQAAAALPMNILAQYVKDLSFENPHAPQSLMASQSQPQVNIGVDVNARQAGDDVFEVTLELKCEAKRDEATVFLAELTYAGLFQLPGVPQEHHAPLLMIEGARLLFPFARAIMADATREGGFPPLLINPIDFVDLFRRRVAAAQQQAGGDGPQASAGGQPPF